MHKRPQAVAKFEEGRRLMLDWMVGIYCCALRMATKLLACFHIGLNACIILPLRLRKCYSTSFVCLAVMPLLVISNWSLFCNIVWFFAGSSKIESPPIRTTRYPLCRAFVSNFNNLIIAFTVPFDFQNFPFFMHSLYCFFCVVWVCSCIPPFTNPVWK